jgi:hypothetical protein
MSESDLDFIAFRGIRGFCNVYRRQAARDSKRQEEAGDERYKSVQVSVSVRESHTPS